MELRSILFFLHHLTGIVVTNDGNAILRELDLAHPAAKARFVSLLHFIEICVPLLSRFYVLYKHAFSVRVVDF